MRERRYWLMKSEPDVYSIDDLKREGQAHWDGVRNYQARNFMRDQMKLGDLVLFYHSNSDPSGVVGMAEVCKESYPDPTQFDPKSEYYDSRAIKEKPVWMMVDIKFVQKFPRTVSLEELRQNKKIQGMLVLKRGMRLSVQPVEREHFQYAEKLGRNL
ncbi:EVE domain-containing protein [bacterium F11]|nr:EVE domain-containing protein [bacterium F11]